MTARELYDRLTAAGVRLAADELTLLVAGKVPAELVEPATVLATGLRAIVTGRKWYGERSDKPGLEVLPVDQRLPEYVTLLCVEGDREWDRVRLYLPEVYRGAKREAAREAVPREAEPVAREQREAANAVPF